MRTIIALVAISGCIEQLPPPPMPPRIVRTPTIQLGPPPPGSSAVTIDSDRPAAVDEIVGTVVVHHSKSYSQGDVRRLVCLTTPCVAHFTEGPHVLQFRSLPDDQWAGVMTIVVTDRASSVNYALGHVEPGVSEQNGAGVQW
jgi:hypothetical protein